MAIFLTITTTAAPFGASFLVDRIGTYQPLLILICCISLIATTIMLLMKPDRGLFQSPVLTVDAADTPTT